MSTQAKQIVLASRPTGAPTADNFRLESTDLPAPAPGEILVEVSHMSLDPYMRGRMDDGKSYAAPVAIGDKMQGGAVGTVLASAADGFAEGDTVFGPFGWASHAVAEAALCRGIPPGVPITTALGVLGMPGFTGWFGLKEYGRPKAGETLVVGAATGPVGSMVGQLAKAQGLRTVGLAGGAEKCALATDTFGFDACLDHRAYGDARSLRVALGEVCPNGIDIYFENVGGMVLEAVVPMMNPFGRIPVCGMIAWYNAGNMGAGGGDAMPLPRLWSTILTQFLSVNGFIIANHWGEMPAFYAEVGPMVADGRVRYLEDITEGLENAPSAFMALLEGGNMGKAIVKVA